jgi:hypothetical protein
MSRARDLSRLSNQTNFTTDVATGRVGLGSENPTAKLNVTGIVSATAFYGDGSNLEGVASAGLGTAIADDDGAGSVIYYTDKVLGVAANITVDVPDASSSNVAYTQYEEISVDSGIDFIVADGDDFVPDILGISSDVQVPGILAGGGGRVRADNFTNKAGTGAPTFSSGVNVTGVATATSFSGNITGTTATFTGNVSVGGTLTYEDVKNIDSVGLITARTGIKVLAGGINAVGVVTATSFVGSGQNLTNLPASGDSNDITACLFI